MVATRRIVLVMFVSAAMTTTAIRTLGSSTSPIGYSVVFSWHTDVSALADVDWLL
jgi:hypothetical protein